MSPEGPRFPSESKSYENDDDKKNKRTKKGANVRVPAGLVSLEKPVEPEPKSKPADLSPIEKALADLAAKRAEKAEPSEEKPAEEADHTAKPEALTPESSLETEQTATQDLLEDPEEDYKPLPEYSPSPNALSGGEVVIHLNGEEPVAERVIPLHAQAEDAGELDTSEESVEETPVSVAQPLQQQGGIERTTEVVPELAVEPELAPTYESLPLRPAAPQINLPPTPEVLQPPTATYPPEAVRQRDLAPFGPSHSEKPASKQDVEDALYYAEKAGQQRGVLTGLIVGGAYEHFKHKRREKKAEKRFRQQSKQLEQVRKDFAFREQDRAKQASNQERQYNALEKRLENTVAAEKSRKKGLEVQSRDQSPEQLKIPDDHRIETSAWHAIEVDAKTGRAVENPTFEYGHEYYRERAKEAAPAMQRNSAAGELALVAATGAGQGAQAQSPAPTSPPDIPNASMQGPPPGQHKDNSSDSADNPAKSSSMAAGPIWPWVAALVVIVVLLAILIR